MNLTPEEKAVGQANYHEAVGAYDSEDFSRRDFLKGAIAAGAVSGAGLGAMYFGYGTVNSPLRVGVIGTGDEGGVLIGALNPDYVDVVAVADIRPYNIHRAFHGDQSSETALAARPGLMSKYNYYSEGYARRRVKVYSGDYKELLQNPDVEAVIIALPLHLHAEATVAALKAGKHVLTEKLMAHNIAQCKVMGRLAEQENLLLATGHQRHYSVLYDNAVHLLKWGLLGQVHFIRAQWHRGNLPGSDSWQQPLPGGEMRLVDGKLKKVDHISDRIKAFEAALKRERDSEQIAKLEAQLAQWKAWNEDQAIDPAKYGYQTVTLPNGRKRTAMEELCRWRLWNRTGGGLMAELGSHQLDAASIFIGSLDKQGKKPHPLSVHAVGGRHIFPLDRDADDHVYCTFEFPGPEYEPGVDPGYKITTVPEAPEGIPGHEQDPNKKIIVTYSSIMGNGYGGYGETVMGTRGTLVLEREKEVMLFKTSNTSTKVKVKKSASGPTMDTQESGAPTKAANLAAAQGPVSRGYTEEIEHWAWCIRNRDPYNLPKCRPEVALGDAVIALGTNVAMHNAANGKGGYLAYKEEWFDINDDATPDGSNVEEEQKDLGA